MLNDRKIGVEIASKQNKKTHTIVRAGTSATPEPSTAGITDHPSDSIMASPSSPPPTSDAKTARQRTIALLNIPDTVNAARIESLATRYGGPVKKVSLRHDHGGAIIEYAAECDAGKASLGLQGFDLDGSTVRVGTVPELFERKGPVSGGGGRTGASTAGKSGNDNNDGGGGKKKLENKGKGKEKSSAAGPGGFAHQAQFARSVAVSRPALRTAGKRGARLGARPAVGLVRGHQADGGKDAGDGDGDGAKTGRSNDDFRRLLVGGGKKKDGE